ncbi:glycosyltransferase family 87 protein [Streptomyces mashuensis]|uniref:glycosyltransferase family 87 protein n=1 Tax=Streptomyces mashuensis TaxID=33904 RepID=UPI00167D8BB5|nr:glycosyltransferase family 87 protein [Streptomyces mashuensis]
MVLFTLSAARPYAKSRIGLDNAVVVRAARTLLEGGSPYADRRFLYLPGAVFAALPQAGLPERVLFYAVPLATGAFVGAGALLALGLFEVRRDSRLAALLLVGLAFFLPFQSLVFLGNWTVVAIVAFPAALLLARRGRWSGAGAVVGGSIALKPMLVPVLLLFVLARRWRALGWAVALAAVLSLAAAVAMPHPELFLTRTLPFLLHGQDAYARPYDASWPAVLPRLGVPQAPALVLGCVFAVGLLGAAWLRWRGGERCEGRGEALRLVECASLLMLAAFVVCRPSFQNYALVVVPSLAVSVVAGGAAARSVWFWVPLVPEWGGVPWPGLESAVHHAFKDIVMYGGLGMVLAVTAWRQWRGWRVVTPPGSPGTAGVVTLSSCRYSLCKHVGAGRLRKPPEVFRK